MVLFKEDDKRIKEQEKQEKLAKRSPLNKFLRRAIKICLVLGGIFLVSLWVLSTLGGNSEQLQRGIEQYLTQASGLHTEIGTFNHMKFFPELSLDAANVKMRRDEKSDPVVTVADVKFATGFFDLMFYRRKVKHLSLEDLSIAPDVIGAQGLKLSHLSLQKSDKDEEKPLLVAEGKYGDSKISLKMATNIVTGDDKGETKKASDDENDFSLIWGNLRAKGSSARAKGGGTKIILSETNLPDNIMIGEILVKKHFSKTSVKADLTIGKSRLQSDLTLDKNRHLSGDINLPVFALDDTDKFSRLIDFVSRLPMGKPVDQISFGDLNADIDFNVKALRGPYGDMDGVFVPLKIHDNVLKADFKGKPSGGKLSGRMTLNATQKPAALDIKAVLKNWDYGIYQRAMFERENVSGTADVNVALKASGKDASAMLASLSGEAVMIAGEGKMASAALNIWGAGLVRALLPSLDADAMTTMNCTIADFALENGVATPRALLVDTARVTVVGEGSIDLVKDKIDLKLEPKAKNPALLDVATAVRVKGPVLKPEISADTFSLFEKIGGLALGFVNPAFLAFSLTDLGLTESHPCHQFLAPPEEKKEEEKQDASPVLKEKQEFNE